MREIIGNNIQVFLKDDRKDTIIGVLVNVTDRTIYVQTASDMFAVFAIPRENIEYCATDSLPAVSRDFINSAMPRRGPPPPPVLDVPRERKQEEKVIDRLNVYINQQQVAGIPIPPTFPVDTWSDKILRVIMGNPDVKALLAGKVQKSIEYLPGEVYIELTDVEPPSQMPETPEQHGNTFSMGGSPTTEYLNPSQMVTRLNKVARGNNDKEEA